MGLMNKWRVLDVAICDFWGLHSLGRLWRSTEHIGSGGRHYTQIQDGIYLVLSEVQG